MAQYKWIQISDIHYAYNNLASTDIRNSFKEQFFGQHFDLIFLTGDFSYRNNFDEATIVFIKEFIEKATCQYDHVFLVPGNHDINRSSMRAGALGSIKNIESTNLNMLYTFDMGLQAYKSFCAKLMDEEYAKLCTYPCIVKSLPEFKLDVVLLNTCLTSYGDDDREHLYICSDILQKKLINDIDNEHIQIVIGHHGFDFLTGAEGKKLANWLVKYTNTKLYLCGHAHDLGVKVDDGATQVVCGALVKDDQVDCGCVVGIIDTESKKVEGTCYCFSNNAWQVSKKADGSSRYFSAPLEAQIPANASELRRQDDHSRNVNYIPSQFDKENFLLSYIQSYILSSSADHNSKISSFNSHDTLIWKEIFSMREYSLALRLADKIYSIFVEDPRFPFVSNLSSVPKSGIVELITVNQWRSLLSSLIGITYEECTSCNDISCLYCACIQPIEKDINAFKSSLSRYIVHPNYLTRYSDIYGYFSGIKEQIERDEKEFKLRAEVVKWITDAWQLGDGQYLLLEASEGFGKTLLCSHLLYNQANAQIIIGSGSKAGGIAPWLPNMLCVFGKSTKTSKRAFQLLMAQVNSILVSPINFDEQSNYADVLTLALKELVDEVGNVLIIVDAMDEFSFSKDAFCFLPMSLPQGATALLTMRKENGIRKQLEDMLSNTQSKSLSIFRKQEIPIILGLNKGHKDDSFLKKVIQRTNGIPILVSQAAKAYSINGKDALTNIDPTIDSYFRRMRMVWLKSATCKAILMLLVLAESVEQFTIDMELLLCWVRARTGNNDIDSDVIRCDLLSVQDQLDNPETGIFGLRYHGFAESMVGTNGYTCAEWESGMQTVLDLYNTNKIDTVPASILVIHANRPQKSNANWERIGCRFVASAKVKRDENALLFLIHSLLSDKKKNIPKIDSTNGSDKQQMQNTIIDDAINTACDLQLNYACEYLYDYYYVAVGSTESKQYALKYLQTMSDNGFIDATSVLGYHNVTDETGEFAYGIQLLEQAVKKGNLHAHFQLACILAKGKQILKDIRRAAALLDIPGNNVVMKNRLAYIYVVEWDDKSMCDKGAAIWKQTWDQGSRLGGFNYAICLLESSKIEEKDEGKRILNTLADSGMVDALSAIGDSYRYGINGFNVDNKKAQKYLKQAADTGTAEEKFQYADFLLSEYNNGQVHPMTYTYFRQAADEGNAEAMYRLGEEQLDNGRLRTNIPEGILWLKRAHEKSNLDAMALLGKLQIVGIYVEQDVMSGVNMLRSAADQDCIKAIIEIVDMHLNNYTHFSSEEIVRWLKKADDEGDIYAPYYLFLVYQRIGSFDISYLLRAKERGNNSAHILYDYKILCTNDDKIVLTNTLEDLKGLGENDNDYALWMLYHVYSGKTKISADTRLARSYLERAATHKYIEAMEELDSLYAHEPGKMRERKELQSKINRNRVNKDFNQFEDAGVCAYSKKDYSAAVDWFVKGMQAGQLMCGSDLACMIRRGEANPELLSQSVLNHFECVLENAPFAENRYIVRMNIALCRLLGCSCDIDHLAAYNIFTELAGNTELFRNAANWWLELARYGDKEGCLVALVLYTFGVLVDSYNLDMMKCYRIAESYSLPDWIRKPT